MPTFTLSIPQSLGFFATAPLALEDFFKDTYPDTNYPAAVHVLLTYYQEFEKNALDEGATELIFDTMIEDDVYTISVSSNVSTGFNDHFKENISPEFRQQLNEGMLIPYSAVLQDKLVFPSQKGSHSSGGNGMGMSITNALLEKFQGNLFIQEQSNKVFFYLSAKNTPCASEVVRDKKREMNAEYQAVLKPSFNSHPAPIQFNQSKWKVRSREVPSPSASKSGSPSSPPKKRYHPSSIFHHDPSQLNSCQPHHVASSPT